MLGLLKYIPLKLDFVALAEASRKKNNRTLAARLHLMLVVSYEIIQLYGIIIDELSAALNAHSKESGRDRFYLNAARIRGLLLRQSDNLEIMEKLLHDSLLEVSVIDRSFKETYESIFPGKFGMLFDAIGLLADGRLPLSDQGPELFPAEADGKTYRTLWFASGELPTDRADAEKYLHGYDGRDKRVIDVAPEDGERFFKTLEAYLSQTNPKKQLEELKASSDRFRQALLDNFTIEDILADIDKVALHENWTK